jgi:branched-chain amino acid transport system ATP-binding protein
MEGVAVNALETRRLCKAFGSLVVANDVELTVPLGARHALIGPNGAGKTTLINLITGTLLPDSGTISLLGEEITSLEPHSRAKRGMGRTFQINTLFPQLTPLESVAMAICERTGISGNFLASLARQEETIGEAYELLTSVGLGSVATRGTRELAYGQQRLLEIALALASQPRMLLLDEPAAGVPRSESKALFDVIGELPRDISVLFIEHDMDIVFSFAERITVLVQGTILTEGTPAEISSDSRVREVYLGSAGNG